MRRLRHGGDDEAAHRFGMRGRSISVSVDPVLILAVTVDADPMTRDVG